MDGALLLGVVAGSRVCSGAGQILNSINGLADVFFVCEITGGKADGAFLGYGSQKFVNIRRAVKSGPNTNCMVSIKHGSNLIGREITDVDGQG